jgi:hypothetical protein
MTLPGKRSYSYGDPAGARNCTGSKALAPRSFVYIKTVALRTNV